MLALMVFFLVAFIPLKVKVCVNINNADVRGIINVSVIYGKLIDVKFFNIKQSPLEFKIKIFKKVFSIKKLNETEKKIEAFTTDSVKFNLKFINSLKKYIKRLDICGRVGIRDRADTTAIIVGYLNGVIIPLVKVIHIKKANFCFTPAYNMDLISVNLECIIWVTPANIIHEGIRYYLKRRIYNGKHNRRRNGCYSGQTQGNG